MASMRNISGMSIGHRRKILRRHEDRIDTGKQSNMTEYHPEDLHQQMADAFGDPIRLNCRHQAPLKSSQHSGVGVPSYVSQFQSSQSPGFSAFGPYSHQRKSMPSSTPGPYSYERESMAPSTPVPYLHHRESMPSSTPGPYSHERESMPSSTPGPYSHERESMAPSTPGPYLHHGECMPSSTPGSYSQQRESMAPSSPGPYFHERESMTSTILDPYSQQREFMASSTLGPYNQQRESTEFTQREFQFLACVTDSEQTKSISKLTSDAWSIFRDVFHLPHPHSRERTPTGVPASELSLHEPQPQDQDDDPKLDPYSLQRVPFISDYDQYSQHDTPGFSSDQNPSSQQRVSRLGQQLNHFPQEELVEHKQWDSPQTDSKKEALADKLLEAINKDDSTTPLEKAWLKYMHVRHTHQKKPSIESGFFDTLPSETSSLHGDHYSTASQIGYHISQQIEQDDSRRGIYPGQDPLHSPVIIDQYSQQGKPVFSSVSTGDLHSRHHDTLPKSQQEISLSMSTQRRCSLSQDLNRLDYIPQDKLVEHDQWDSPNTGYKTEASIIKLFEAINKDDSTTALEKIWLKYMCVRQKEPPGGSGLSSPLHNETPFSDDHSHTTSSFDEQNNSRHRIDPELHLLPSTVDNFASGNAHFSQGTKRSASKEKSYFPSNDNRSPTHQRLYSPDRKKQRQSNDGVLVRRNARMWHCTLCKEPVPAKDEMTASLHLKTTMHISTKYQSERKHRRYDNRESDRRQRKNHNLRKMFVPRKAVRLVIGRGGAVVHKIQDETGASIQFDPQDHKSHVQVVRIDGTEDQVKNARKRINKIMDVITQRNIEVVVPMRNAGAIIGRRGERIAKIQEEIGAFITFDEDHKSRIFKIYGTADQLENAERKLQKLITLVTTSKIQLDTDSEYKTEMLVPKIATGAIIGHNGKTIHRIEEETGAYIKLNKENFSNETQSLQISGTESQRNDARRRIQNIIETTIEIKILVPEEATGNIVGFNGVKINRVRRETGACIKLDTVTSKNQTRCLWINGTEEQINDARQRIEKLIAQSTESEIQDRVQHGHRLEHETQSRNKYVKEPVAEKKKNICFVKPKQILRKTKMKVETTNDGANVTKSKIVDDSLLKPLVMYASSDEEEDVTIDTK